MRSVTRFVNFKKVGIKPDRNKRVLIQFHKVGIVDGEDALFSGVFTFNDSCKSNITLIGGENHRSFLISATDQLEEQIGTRLVDGQVADLVDDQEPRDGVGLELLLELALGGGQAALSARFTRISEAGDTPGPRRRSSPSCRR